MITYKEWMTATCARFNMSETDVDLVLLNNNLFSCDEVDVKKAKRALVNEFASIIPLANISEGGYSVSWNMDAVKMWYNQMCGELGIVPVTNPKIRNRSNRW